MFSEVTSRMIISQILLGCDYMHSKEIVHKDLKLANILLSSSENGEYDIRIIDFGLSHYIGLREHSEIIAGTPGFIAPEMLKS